MINFKSIKVPALLTTNNGLHFIKLSDERLTLKSFSSAKTEKIKHILLLKINNLTKSEIELCVFFSGKIITFSIYNYEEADYNIVYC
mgnify:CR=1 FL=1